jgi:hypothetical protein
LLAELDDLEQESLDEQLLGLETTPAVRLPTAPTKCKYPHNIIIFSLHIYYAVDVPTRVVLMFTGIGLAPVAAAPAKKQQQIDEDAELAALEASMA